MTWLALRHGLPKEPHQSDWNELADLPTAHDFYEQLFMKLCGVDVKSGQRTGETGDPGYTRRVHGFQGTKDIGYRWIEEKNLETSLIPLHVETETYGLPGMTIRWDFSWAYSGQAGHAAFRHRSLNVRFDPADTFESFRRVWQDIFKEDPLFQPASEPPSGVDRETEGDTT